ncbi:MAG: DUF1592 domain-containing protein [Myxococcota bacterium]
MTNSTGLWRAIGAALLAIGGCEGVFDSMEAERTPVPGVNEPLVCVAPGEIAPPVGRRLTAGEYEWAVTDLLALNDRWNSDGRFADGVAGGFLVSTSISEIEVERYEDAARSLSELGAERFDTLLPCSEREWGRSCVEEFVRSFGSRAFRRPLEANEADALMSLYDDAERELRMDFRDRVRLVIEAVLQSPSFLFRVEAPAKDGMLDPDALAARLSFFFWRSIPDDALLDAAASGVLATADGLEAEARRMLADPKAARGVEDFHLQWLGVEGAGVHASAEDEAHMRTELRRFVEHTVLEERGSLRDLLTSDSTFANGAVGEIYGVEASEEFARVPLPPDRSGVLSMPIVLSAHAHSNATAQIHRGKMIRERLLCETLPPPPADALDMAPSSEGLTAREYSEAMSADALCGSCHQMMDRIGLGLAGYDKYGRFDADTDDRGAIVGFEAGREPVDFRGARELAELLAGSDQVERCVTRQWFTYAFGRTPTPEDECTMEELHHRFADTGFEIVELMVAIVGSDAFRFGTFSEGGACQ